MMCYGGAEPSAAAANFADLRPLQAQRSQNPLDDIGVPRDVRFSSIAILRRLRPEV
jgi:hypothetical protein